MIKNLKKAFTIIELVIVIAVIAILAAVMIPTYSSLVEKANQSADIQAVKQMNTILALDEVDSIKSIANVHEALNAEGLDSENFTPLVSDTYFYWLEDENRIVYVDNNKKVIYPEEYKSTSLANYCSLNGVLNISNLDKNFIDKDSGVATVSTAEQLYYLSTSQDQSVTEIKFANDVTEIDVHGADIGFVFKDSTKTFKITGANGGTTIKNAVSFNTHLVNEGNDYASGFVAHIGDGVTLTILNITIDGGIFGDLETGGVGALIGRIGKGVNYSSEKVTIKNCNVQNAIINGKNKVGALIGSIDGDYTKVKIDGCNVTSCTVNCTEGESGKAIGCMYNSAQLTIDKKFSDWVKDTTLNLVKTEREIVDGSNLNINSNYTSKFSSYKLNDCEKMIKKLGNEEEYRMFSSEAYLTMILNKNYEVIVGNVKDEGHNALYDHNSEYGKIIELNGKTIKVNILEFIKD